MLALRRASISIRLQALGIHQASSTACVDFERRPISQIPDQAVLFDWLESTSKSCISFNGFYRNIHSSPNLLLARQRVASKPVAKSGGEEEDDELIGVGFSELEAEDSDSANLGTTAQSESEDELISEPEFSEYDDVAEPDTSKKVPSKRRTNPGLLKAVISAKGPSVPAALAKWVEGGNEIDREEAILLITSLRKFRMYGKALQVSEWLESSGTLELNDRDYSFRLDLIAKLHGLEKAEKYIERIPESFRREFVYETLLASYVLAFDYKKAEEIFSKIKNEFALTPFSCNQMILLYKRSDRSKIGDVLLLMEKENLKPSSFTYRLLVDIKGTQGDIAGMEQILETMKAEGHEPSGHTKCIAARHYALAGMREKAEELAKLMEEHSGSDPKHLRDNCRFMIQLYGDLGSADGVKQAWKICEPNPYGDECLAAIEAWGKLKKVEEAEAVFEKMMKRVKIPSSLHYNTLLKVYSSNKLLEKGKDLIKQMSDAGCQIGPVALDSLVRLYVDAGEVWKADSVLHKAVQQKSAKPMFTSYINVMDQYARKGDVHNTEKIFHRMRESGYLPRSRQFQILVKAYMNAKAPLYGMRERMKGDSFFPSKGLLGQMELVDAFRKTAASDLLE